MALKRFRVILNAMSGESSAEFDDENASTAYYAEVSNRAALQFVQLFDGENRTTWDVTLDTAALLAIETDVQAALALADDLRLHGADRAEFLIKMAELRARSARKNPEP